MNLSKYFKIEGFKPIPKTDAANCFENIDNWINTNNINKIKEFLIPDEKGYKGFRFIQSSDLKETITQNIEVLKVPIKVKITRFIHTTDHFCPLWFSVWKYEISFCFNEINDNYIIFKSDNSLIKQIREYKKTKSYVQP